MKLPHQKDRPTIEHVVNMVADHLGTETASLTRKGRHRNRGREAVVLLARELTTESLDALGHVLGGLSRSGVSELARRAEERVNREPEFAALVAELRRQLS